jgi:hypothetical protein
MPPSGLKQLKDISTGAAYGLDASRQGNPVTSFLAKVLQSTARDANYKSAALLKEIEDKRTWFMGTEGYRKHKFEVFLQRHEGEWTGNMVTLESVQWHKDVSALKRSVAFAAGSNKLHKVKGKIAQFRRFANTEAIIIDIYKLYDAAQKDEYLKYLEQEVGPERATELVAQAKSKVEHYWKQLASIKLNLDIQQTLDSSFTDSMKSEALLQWKERNSPFAAFDEIMNDQVSDIMHDRKNYSRLVIAPRNSANTKYFDSNWTTIQNDPDLKEFYNWYRDKLSMFMDLIPAHLKHKNRIYDNFLPKVRKDLLKSFLEGGTKIGMQHLKSEAIFGLGTAPITGSALTIGDRTVEEVPFNYLNPITKKVVVENRLVSGVDSKHVQEVNAADEMQSKDLFDILGLFGHMAYNYQHKSVVEDISLLTKRVVENAAEVVVDAGGKNIYDKTKKKFFTKSKGLENLNKSLQYLIDASLYGNRNVEIGQTNQKLFADPEMKKLHEAIVRELVELEQSKDSMSLADYLEKKEELEEQMKTLDYRLYTHSKALRQLMQVTQLKGMGYNIFSAFSNIGFGVMANFIHANGRRDFDNSSMMKAWTIMLHASGKSVQDNTGIPLTSDVAKKVAALMDKFDVLFEVNEAAYNKSSKRRTWFSKWAPYELQKRSEYFVQGMTMVAMLLHEKVTDVNGKERTLFEAFNADGEWNATEFGLNENWSGDIDTEMKDFKAFRNKMIQLIKRIHGNYDPNSPILIKKTILGQMLMQFRSWMPEGIASRFEKEDMDEQLGRVVRGRWATYGDIGALRSLFTLGRQLLYMNDPDKAFELIRKSAAEGGEFNVDTAIENMRKNLSELAFLALLTAFMWGLKYAFEDDEDEVTKAAYHMMMNQFSRVAADLYFYINPSTFEQIIKNPLPVFRTVIDFVEAFDTTQEELFTEDTDWEKVQRNTYKAFPIVNNVNKWKTQADSILE